MIMFSVAVPTEDIVREIRDAAQDVLLFPDDEEKMKMLMFHCHMFAMNRRAGGTIEGAQKVIQEFESMEAKLKLFEDTSIN